MPSINRWGALEPPSTTLKSRRHKKTSVQALTDLTRSINGGSVELLLILGGNPVYDCPADVKLELRGNSQMTSVYLGLFDNETAKQCTWHATASHFLESWHDGRDWDGTYSIGQPLIYPLSNGISATELLSLAVGQPAEDSRSLIRESVREQFKIETQKQWNHLLHDGILVNTEFDKLKVEAQRFVVADTPQAQSENPFPVPITFDATETQELCFIPDASTYEGRFANNGWLQELPDPLTKLTWDNAALISKKDADRYQLANGDVIRIAEVG
jgi:molybdopterin-containing oxidoreductase family iron-sulfur binding subunit